MRDFRKYDIWLKAVDLADFVYKLTDEFPKSEMFSLSNQLQRAVVSISSNIAEGCSRESEKEFSHFLEISIGSAFEVETQLLVSLKRNYITKENYEIAVNGLNSIEKQIHNLINILNKSRQPSQS